VVAFDLITAVRDRVLFEESKGACFIQVVACIANLAMQDGGSLDGIRLEEHL